MKHKVMAFAALTLFAAACTEQTSENEKPDVQTEVAPSAGESQVQSSVVILEISGNDQMQFDKKELVVKAGSTVKLTFKHVGELPIEAMGHNWTLLAQGVDLVEYAQAAMTYSDNGYQVEGRENDVIATTRILGPGESETIEFPAPAKGTYAYLCTFPGHFGMMRGSFIVR